MILVSELILLAIVLYFVQEWLRRATSMISSWAVFVALPLVLTPLWLRTDQVGIFPWIKLYSILFGACWVSAIRFTSLGQKPWALASTVVFLAANIAEAVTADVFGGHTAHFLLAVSGILLVLSLPHPLVTIRVTSKGPLRELSYEGLTREWVVGYTVWNWAFVYLNFPAIAGHQLAVLSVSLMIGMIEPRQWLQTRAYTLAIDLLVLFTFPHLIVPILDTTHWASAHRENVVAGICFVIVALEGFALAMEKHPSSRMISSFRLFHRRASSDESES